MSENIEFPIEIGDIIQVVPEHEWGLTLMIVKKVAKWGVQAYCNLPLMGITYIRLKHDEYVIVGAAAFIKDDD